MHVGGMFPYGQVSSMEINETPADVSVIEW